jgi:Cu+-exporting ATPase
MNAMLMSLFSPGVMPGRVLRYACKRLIREDIMEKDVVCGMRVDPAKAAGTSELNGKTYYFCSKGCKTKFDANPGEYTK